MNLLLKTASLLLLSCALVFLPATCPAGIDNSHHDVRHYLPDKDACLTCHSRKDVNYYGVMEEDLGRVGGQCIFLCHSGKGILPETDTLVPKPGPSVNTDDYSTSETPDYTSVFFTRSHGRIPEKLKDRGGNPVTWPPAGVTWQGVGAGVKLECTSCHAVHDNRYPPFLYAPLGATSAENTGLCSRCHIERATNNLTDSPDGSHPVDFIVDGEIASQRNSNVRHPRRILIQKYGKADGTGAVNVFDVPNPRQSSLNDVGSSWSMGGHLFVDPSAPMTPWVEKGGRQQMGCYTCHPAHRTNINGETNLVAVKASDPENGWNPLCTGCHGAARTLEGDRADWDVGMTAYGHPAGSGSGRGTYDNGYTSTVGGFRFAIAKVTHIAPQSGNRFGNRGELLCTTCHKVHFGQPKSNSIANLGQGTKSICKTCHSGIGIPNLNDASKGGTATGGHNTQNSHHVTATSVTLSGSHVPANEAQPLYILKPTWASESTGLGDIANGMDCPDCHTFNATAHNW